MIRPEQVDEWIHEVEARPSSAALIIEYISRRLADLSGRNEALLAENIELRTGRKVEDYESRISTLEYQVELLKRQLSGAGEWVGASPTVDTISLLVYNIKGQVLRLEITINDLETRREVAHLGQAVSPSEAPPRLLMTLPHEELVFVFDSGRAITRAVQNVLAAENEALEWDLATIVEPHGNEELTVVTAVGRMALADCCVQISRRGMIKKIMRSSFESHLSKEFIGSGIKAKPDKNAALVLCAKDDAIVLASRDGFLLTTEVSGLPYTAEESMKLSVGDHIISGFSAGEKPSVLFMTQNGKAIHREASWLEFADTNKTRGQVIIPPARREAGVRLIGAAAVDEKDWAAVLRRDGKIMVYKIADLFENGSLGDEAELVDFVPFTIADSKTG